MPEVTEYIDATVQPPTDATHRLVLCPSGSLHVSAWFGTRTGTYDLTSGRIDWQLGHDATVDGGTIYANGTYDSLSDSQPGYSQFWMQTNEEATRAAKFCSTGTW